MEQEIDLRPYLQAVVRQWRLIVGLMVILGALAAGWTILAPRPAQARGDILVIPQSAQISLDPRFTERDSTMFTNSVNQRQALIDLATSSALEARVAESLGLSPYQPGMLLSAINVKASSDLLQIGATAPTSDEALRLAETWSRSYEVLVNELFSGTNTANTQIDEQITSAQQRFEATQSALNDFYAKGDLVQAEKQAKRLEGLLNGGIDAQVRLYTQYVSRTQELGLILEDARTLQAENEAGASGDLSAGLAALTVRARLAGTDQLPVQLSFASAESFAQGQAGATDLTRFVTVLTGERDRMVAQASALSSALAAGDGSAVGHPAHHRARKESELAKARGALARATGDETLLFQRRDVALSSLKVLQSKRDEGQIAQAAPAVSVHFVDVATVAQRSVVASLLINLAVAVLIGFLLAVVWIVGREIIRRLSASAPSAPQERSADSPIHSN
jgi:capsular polysaccharide biosynthesis protein